MAEFHGEVEVTYHSFELRPEAPVDIDKEQQIAQHTGANRERVEAINAHLAELAHAEGQATAPTSLVRRTRTSPSNSSTTHSGPGTEPH